MTATWRTCARQLSRSTDRGRPAGLAGQFHVPEDAPRSRFVATHIGVGVDTDGR
ncbi:hypothetical protein QM996_32610 (plasmid) [Sinorhizobium chiapasense]|uniref:hypothetical protein n=1 Tax=Sinorhizobium chiapasense TaxID=501572 RepID=UPI002FE34A9E